MTEQGKPVPCGGCGAMRDAERCMGCLHDFGTPESAWVRRYAKPHTALTQQMEGRDG